jgi:hypothetical protein
MCVCVCVHARAYICIYEREDAANGLITLVAIFTPSSS